jgi:predicted enzyme involved in methoxymalonyl-ACP biosynthesis
MSREEFLSTLGSEVALNEVATPQDPDFARSVELLNKTNQFNTIGIRWTNAEISTFLALQGRMFTFRVKDNYTKYGLVGTILYGLGHFVQVAMSCRVLGLEIETSVIHAIMRSMRAEGQTEFCGRIVETDANMVCRDLFSRCGFDRSSDDPGLFAWSQAAIPPKAGHLQMELSNSFG